MTDSLVDRIRAVLDEDERVARATLLSPNDHGSWIETRDDEDRVNGILGTCIHISVTNSSGTGDLDDPAQAEHIARHDPARVLRQVAALRKMLELHEPFIADEDEPDPICQTCVEGSHLYDESAYPCPTLLAIAEAYGIEYGGET